MHGAEVFLELCDAHTALEETLMPRTVSTSEEAACAAQVAGTAP